MASGRKTLLLSLAVAASIRTSVRADCIEVLQSLLASQTCSQLEARQTSAGQAAEGLTCEGVKAVNEKWYPEGTPTECCPALRDMVTSGCACDENFLTFAGALVGLDLAMARKVIAGSVMMIQESSCTSQDQGGPMLDACTGQLGPCSSKTQ
eukprot:jgi/Botrbrau1/9495/Bobra.0252s0110.1